MSRATTIMISSLLEDSSGGLDAILIQNDPKITNKVSNLRIGTRKRGVSTKQPGEYNERLPQVRNFGLIRGQSSGGKEFCIKEINSTNSEEP